MKRMRTGKKEENRKKFVFSLHVICSVFTKIVLYKNPSSFLRARTKNLYTLQDLYNIYLYKVFFLRIFACLILIWISTSLRYRLYYKILLRGEPFVLLYSSFKSQIKINHWVNGMRKFIKPSVLRNQLDCKRVECFKDTDRLRWFLYRRKEFVHFLIRRFNDSSWCDYKKEFLGFHDDPETSTLSF